MGDCVQANHLGM